MRTITYFFLIVISGAAVAVPAFVYSQESVDISIGATIEFTEPFVATHPATAIETDKANLHGELVSLGPEVKADVFFQYRDKGSPFWSETPKQTAEDPTLFSATLTGLNEGATYEFRAGVEWNGNYNYGNTLEFTTGKEIKPPPPSPPSLPPAEIETAVVFQGRAYPSATVTILKNDSIIAVFRVKDSGVFKEEIKGIDPGNYNFSIFAEDAKGRKSVTLGFGASILEGRITTISGIFLSPTIELDSSRVERGDNLNIFGHAFPESQVKIFIASDEVVKETKATKRGDWSYSFNTETLEEKEHTVKSLALYNEIEKSPFSHTLSFLVLPPGTLTCEGADLNFDRRVDIVDFSILLYFWGQTRPANICADINFDGIVDIVDFSIMMYWWTG